LAFKGPILAPVPLPLYHKNMNRDDATRAYLASLGRPDRAALREVPPCCGNISQLREALANLTNLGGRARAIDLAEARWAIKVAAEGHDLSSLAALRDLRVVLGAATAADRDLMGLVPDA